MGVVVPFSVITTEKGQRAGRKERYDEFSNTIICVWMGRILSPSRNVSPFPEAVSRHGLGKSALVYLTRAIFIQGPVALSLQPWLPWLCCSVSE